MFSIWTSGKKLISQCQHQEWLYFCWMVSVDCFFYIAMCWKVQCWRSRCNGIVFLFVYVFESTFCFVFLKWFSEDFFFLSQWTHVLAKGWDVLKFSPDESLKGVLRIKMHYGQLEMQNFSKFVECWRMIFKIDKKYSKILDSKRLQHQDKKFLQLHGR